MLLSVIGPLARTVEDAAALLDAMAVPCLAEPVIAPPLPPGRSFLHYARRQPGRLRIGRYADSPLPGVELAQVQRAGRAAVAAHAEFDAVLTPTLAQLPRPVGWFSLAPTPAENFERQKRYIPYAALYNVTGQPAISLPMPLDR